MEADFQQYYGIDLEKSYARGFRRFCRLLLNLPLESRFMKKYIPSKDWDFEKETQSRILMQLDMISCQLSNMFRKKGVKPRKPAEQFQPDYVKQAKQEYSKKNRVSEEEKASIEGYFKAHNNSARHLGAEDGK